MRLFRRRDPVLKLALAGQCSAVQRKAVRFYCVELFDNCKLAGIEFFEVDELPQARESAIDAVQAGAAGHARITDDEGRLVFRPASRAPACLADPRR